MNPEGDPPVAVRLTVNGEDRELRVAPRRSLADVLRRDLCLTGTRVGCDLGTCGTCTVVADDEPVRACLTLAVQAEGMRVETVESLAESGKLNELQTALREHFAVQCGFCTPGFLMLATALLRRQTGADQPRTATGQDRAAPSREQIREYLAANLCRCTGYTPIVDAVESVLRSHG